jgi:hypothetical protein
MVVAGVRARRAVVVGASNSCYFGTMPDAFIDAMLKNGPLGLVALVATFAAYKLALKVDNIQERRVTDVEKVLAVVSAITAATDKNTEAIERLAERIGR